MKKILVITASFMLRISSVLAQHSAPGNIVGIWLNEDKNVEIEIYQVGPQYFGKLVSEQVLYAADRIYSHKDGNQSNDGLHKRDLKNLIILNDFDYDHGVYDGGIIYDYKTGKKYKSILKLRGENVLKIRDYNIVSLFGKTTIWTRVSDKMTPR